MRPFLKHVLMVQRRAGVVAGVFLASLIALTGCDVELPAFEPEPEIVLQPDSPLLQEVQPPSTPQDAVTAVEVKRGPISELLRANGRVSPSREQTLYFLSSGQMKTMYTDSHELVEAGALLAEQDTESLQHQRRKALEALERAQVQLDQVRAQSVTTSTAREESDLEAARIRMLLARSALEALQQGQHLAAVKAAEAAVAKAQTDLDRLTNNLAARRITLAAAEAGLSAALSGPDAQAVASAERELAEEQLQLTRVKAGAGADALRSAEVALDIQLTKLSRLQDAPPVDPADVTVARLTVEQAQVNLDRAVAERGGQTGNDLVRAEASVRLAQLALEAAQNSLVKVLGGGPTPWAVRLQELAVQGAENALRRLQRVQPLEIRSAELAVEQARANLTAARAGASEDSVRRLRHQIDQQQRSVAAASAALPSARAALEAARVRLAQLEQGPTDEAYQQAHYRWQASESAYAAAQLRLWLSEQAVQSAEASAAADIAVAERTVEIEAMDLAWVDEQIAKAQIFAPFGGVITRVFQRPGKSVGAFQSIMTVSNPDDLVIRASVLERDVPKLSLGQKAKISIDAFPGVALEGELIGLPAQYTAAQGDVSDNSAIFRVDWPKTGAEVAMRGRLEVIIQHRENALIVPTRAVHSVGRRRFVETWEDGVKRTHNVELGIVGDEIVEILAGLEEGMLVIERS